MKLKKITSFVSMGLLMVSSVIILSSCSCKINEDQLAKLAELRRQEKSLNSEITAEKNAKAKLDNELQSRTNEANDCSAKRDIVKQRLSSWPNIWPDYTVQP
jgi:peptidoglycan hydrolase CwlO-like protein